MRRSHVVGAVLLAACAGFSLTSFAQPAKQAPTPLVAAWEYKSFQHPTYSGGLDQAMNELGAQGWEFCGAHPATKTPDDVPTPTTVYVFKRANAPGK